MCSTDNFSGEPNQETQISYSELRNSVEIMKAEKAELAKQLKTAESKLNIIRNELEREVQKRVELEERFGEEAKLSTDQISELVSKSEQDDFRISDLKRKFEICSREASSMIESFTTNREMLTSQLIELRKENDYLLGKFIGKSRELQSSAISLPQTVEELQFYCLALNEKFILATMAKEQLEETLVQQAHANR